jgi:hypothetical protein
MSALKHQIQGDHYVNLPIQPVEFIHANQLGYIEGAIIKYVVRWKNKGGNNDLLKAKHYIDLLIELETKNGRTHNPHATDRKTAEAVPQADAEARVEGRFEYGRIFDSRGKVTVERNEPRDFRPKDLGDII